MAAAGSGIDELLLLDPAIRNWVLLPIFAVMFLQGVLRQYVTVLLKDEKKTALDAITRAQLLRRSAKVRANSSFIATHSFNMRKKWLIAKAFVQDSQAEDEKAAAASTDAAADANAALPPAQDPMAMVGMMKQNLAMIVPNMLMMGWVSFFFSGFLIVKLPFGLTPRFKSMLQRGIALNSLDVSYVTSISFYIILLFGLRGLFSVVLGNDGGAIDQTELMAQQMQGQMQGPQADPKKLFEAERNELEIIKHEFAITAAQTRLLACPFDRASGFIQATVDS